MTESDEQYDKFIKIMFTEWTADEMAYAYVEQLQAVIQQEQARCAYCGYTKGNPGCTFCI